VQGILEGNSSDRASRKTLKTQGTSKQSKEFSNTQQPEKAKNNYGSVAFVDLKFNIQEMNSLKEYFSLKQPSTQQDEIAVALQWFIDNKNPDGATTEEINYLMKIATGRVPTVLNQVLINMKGPKSNLLEKNKNGRFALTSIGILHISNNLPRKK